MYRTYVNDYSILFLYCYRAAAAICFIRQEASSSSFLASYQRLEGTLVGAVFAFFIFQVLACSSNGDACVNGVKIPILVGWIWLASCFKEGPRHGYSAVVAALTPLVILLLPTDIDSEKAWQRVLMTLCGVSVYLLIDVMIFPNRTDKVVRVNLLLATDELIICFQHAVQCMGTLLRVCEAQELELPPRPAMDSSSQPSSPPSSKHPHWPYFNATFTNIVYSHKRSDHAPQSTSNPSESHLIDLAQPSSESQSPSLVKPEAPVLDPGYVRESKDDGAGSPSSTLVIDKHGQLNSEIELCQRYTCFYCAHICIHNLPFYSLLYMSIYTYI